MHIRNMTRRLPALAQTPDEVDYVDAYGLAAVINIWLVVAINVLTLVGSFAGLLKLDEN